MSDNEEVVAEGEELLYCPNCDTVLASTMPDFYDGGYMEKKIWCSTCDFEAVERWEISDTIRTTEGE